MKRFTTRILPLILMITLMVAVNVFGPPVSDTVELTMSATAYLSLTVHGAVDLGIISAPTDVLESTGHSVNVKANDAYELTVEVQSVTTPPGHPDAGGNYAAFLADLYVKGGALITVYTFFTAKGEAGKLTVADTSSGGDNTYSMSYKYVADASDVPGDYAITLKYTATAK